MPYTTESGAPFPERDLIVFLAFAVIIATLIVQGLSLPALIRLHVLRADGATAREEAQARLEVSQAGERHVERLAATNDAPKSLIERLRSEYRQRTASAAAAASEDENRCRELFKLDARLRREVIRAEREAIINLRERGEIHDDVMRRIEHDIDLEEQQIEAMHRDPKAAQGESH